MREQLRSVAFGILVFGLLLTVISVFADQLALGTPNSGFGWKQITGAVSGMIVTALGLWLTYRLSS